MLTDERLLNLWQQTLNGDFGDILAFARAVEREARREALEEAANACACYECLAAIRALIDKEPRT